MKYTRQNGIWDKWEIEHFNKLFFKMMARKKPNGFPVYKNGEEVFLELNKKYLFVYGKPRFASYQSYLVCRGRK